MHRYTLPGDSQGTPSARPGAVPRQVHRIDSDHDEDRFARFWAGDDDTASLPTTTHSRSAHGAPGFGGPHRRMTESRTPQRGDSRRGGHRRVSRIAGKKKWLLVPVAAMAAALTGGIALAATGAGAIHFRVASPVTVQALGVDVSNAAVGQTVTAGAKVVAASETTLSEVALTVKGPGGIRVDFAHAHDWKLGTSQKVFTGSRAFNRAGTYTYWFMYKKGGHWTSLNPRQTFTVGTPSTPTPGPSTPGATPSPSGPGAPTTGPTGQPTTGPTAAPTPSGPTVAPTPTGSPSGGGSSGGSTAPSASPSEHGCASNPGACGYPTTATAGVPAGTALTVINGGLTITTNGAVISGKEIHGCVDVRASNVTIRNSRIIGPCGSYGVGTYSAGGTTILDRVEINCTDGRSTGIAGPNFAAHAVYVHDCENALEINSNSSVVDSVLTARDGAPTSHGDGIQAQDGTNVVIRHNTLLVPGGSDSITSAIITNPTQDNGWLIEDNLMGGGGYTLYCPEQGTNFVVRNNRFVPPKLGTLYSAKYGLTDACNHPGITWTGNYLDSDGGVVAP